MNKATVWSAVFLAQSLVSVEAAGSKGKRELQLA